MTMSIYLKNTLLTALPTLYVQMHQGDPGVDGTSNLCANTLRKLIALGTPSNGARANSGEIIWVAVPATEPYTHFSLWTAVSGGTFCQSGSLLTTHTVVAGNDARFAPGAFVVGFA